MKYNITLRDKDGDLYKTKFGSTITNRFYFEDSETNENLINLICQVEGDIYEAICKEDTDITIEVTEYSSISNTWMVLYSYYHSEKRFVKHV